MEDFNSKIAIVILQEESNLGVPKISYTKLVMLERYIFHASQILFNAAGILANT